MLGWEMSSAAFFEVTDPPYRIRTLSDTFVPKSSVLVFWVPTDWSHSSKVVYAYLTYMGLGLCYSLVNIPYGSLATAMTQQPQSREPRPSGRGWRDCRFIDLCLPGISDRTEH